MTDAARKLVFRNVRVVGTGGAPIDGTNVWIESGKISKLERGEVLESGQELVDGAGLTLMPGLIDGHLHLLGLPSYDFQVWAMEDPAIHAVRATRDMQALVEAGFTTVRDAGSDVSLVLKRAQVEGSLRGPRVWASGRWISVTGNLPDLPGLPLCLMESRGMGVSANGADECRRAVREQVRAGADIIKIATTGGIDPAFVVAESTMAESELAAIVDTAHGLGRRVSAHNNVLPGQRPVGMRRCIEAGVDSIDHGYYIEDSVLEAMAEKGTYWIITSSYLKVVAERGKELELSNVYIEKAETAFEAVFDTIPRARRTGVPIAIGSDFLGSSIDPHGTNAMELPLMRQAGFSDPEVIELATASNARVLGIDGWTGRIEPGYAADLLLVDGRPDEDVGILTDPNRIRYVMVGGREMKNTLGEVAEVGS
jgi:imidazolonepropionase-like amidohydrolase